MDNETYPLPTGKIILEPKTFVGRKKPKLVVHYCWASGIAHIFLKEFPSSLIHVTVKYVFKSYTRGIN